MRACMYTLKYRHGRPNGYLWMDRRIYMEMMSAIGDNGAVLTFG